MYIDESQATAAIYKEVVVRSGETWYLAKFSLADIKFYITGITVKPSKHGGLWVQLPGYPRGNKYIYPIEASNDSPLMELISSLCIKAAETYIAENAFDDELLNRPLTVDDFPDV